MDANDVCKLLETYAAEEKKLLLLCHVNPDGDTVGSAFALKKIYALLGGTACCACTSDGAGIPSGFAPARFYPLYTMYGKRF